MTYHVVFDISRSWPAIGFPMMGLLFVGVAVLALINGGRLPGATNEQTEPRPGFFVFMLIFAVLWTGAASWGVFGNYFRARNAYLNGDYTVVEGRVEHFVPMPYAGHAYERFEVEGILFEYSDFEVSPGFNNTSSHGGPIREGLPVRIAYTLTRPNRTILKLEVGK